jgi:hypothetical protein
MYEAIGCETSHPAIIIHSDGNNNSRLFYLGERKKLREKRRRGSC